MIKFSPFLIGTALLTLIPTAFAIVQDGNTPTSDGVDSPLPVPLGRAGDFVVLAKSSVSTVPSSIVVGNVGISPAAASFITGFSLSADATNEFSTSTQVTERIYAADYAEPTPAKMTTAVSDMHLAYTDTAGRAPDFTEVGAGNIGGMTLTRGVYKWSTDLLIPTDVKLSGSDTDVWVFQVAQNLDVSSTTRIQLIGGAVARNIFWQVAGGVTIQTNARFEGIVLCQTAITIQTGSVVNGALLAQTAVHIDNAIIVKTYPIGITPYGTGTPGCHGTLGMNANGSPRLNSPEFAFLCSNAPVETMGLGIITDMQDLEGTVISELGIRLHLDLVNSIELQVFEIVSRPLGIAIGRIPIPNEPTLEGRTFYTQTLWSETAGETCSHSPIGLISSNGLAITIQP